MVHCVCGSSPPSYSQIWFSLLLYMYARVNSFGHIGTASSTNHIFSWASLNNFVYIPANWQQSGRDVLVDSLKTYVLRAQKNRLVKTFLSLPTTYVLVEKYFNYALLSRGLGLQKNNKKHQKTTKEQQLMSVS